MHTARSLLYRGGLCPEGVSLDRDPWTETPLTETPGRNMGPETETPRRNMGPGNQTGRDIIQRPLLLLGQTNDSENITLPQTSFAGGNNKQYLLSLRCTYNHMCWSLLQMQFSPEDHIHWFEEIDSSWNLGGLNCIKKYNMYRVVDLYYNRKI